MPDTTRRNKVRAPRTLGNAMRLLGLDDVALAGATGRHRTEIWAYRTGRRVPRANTALDILTHFERRGVRLTLRSLLRVPKGAAA